MRTLILALYFLLPAAASAEIYKWLDDQGRVQFGDRPPPEKKLQPVEIRVNTYSAPEIAYTPAERGKKSNGTPKVVMYSAQWCGVCKQARSYFKKKRIRYKEYDIDESAEGRARYRALKGSGVPIIMVGKSRLNGFSPGHFDRLYQ